MQNHARPAAEPEVLIDTRELARRLGVAPATLVGWRRRHFGPRFVIMGRLVRYPPSAAAAFIATTSVDTDAARDHAQRDVDTRTLLLALGEPTATTGGGQAEGG